MIKAIRTATTVDQDLPELIKAASVEIMSLMLETNQLKLENIISVFFSITPDLKSFNPATAVRENLDWTEIPMICFQEAFIEGGLPYCIRALIHVQNCPKPEIKHIYLHKAQGLRSEWSQLKKI